MAKKKDNTNMFILVIGLFVIMMMIGATTLQGNLLVGYGGMTAEITHVEDGRNLYQGAGFDWDNQIRIMGTTAQVDPSWGGLFLADPTGVRMELTSRLRPVYDAAKNLGVLERPLIDPETGLESGNERIVARIVPMIMGVTVRTYGIGADPIYDVIFHIKIAENDFGYFESADNTMAYIVAVYLIDPPVTTHSQNMQLSPSTGGVEVPTVGIGENPVPAWINEAAGEIDYSIPSTSSVVVSKLTVSTAAPNVPLFAPREENEGSWTIGVDVLVFGKWVVEGELPDFDPQDDPTIWDDFLLSIQNLLGAVGMVIFGVIIVVVLIFILLIVRALRAGREGGGSKGGKSKGGASTGRSQGGINWTS